MLNSKRKPIKTLFLQNKLFTFVQKYEKSSELQHDY